MKGPRLRPVLCTGAIAEEVAPLVKGLARRAHPARPGAGCWEGVIGSAQVVVAITGDGAPSASEAVARLLDAFAPSALLVLGIAGGLSPQLRWGDVVAAREVRTPEGRSIAADHVWTGRAIAAGAIAGVAYSAPRLVGTASEKARVRDGAADGRACIVDLESWALGSAATRAKIPFAVIRAVSDAHDEELPLLVRLAQRGDGSLSRLRIALLATTNLRQVPSLLAYQRRVSRCAAALSDVAIAVLRAR